ncbi:methanogenic corrinoid protein MtbC1 [Rhodothalassium salexigens DSM 2132]|nr:methanogenic corrinoid protein MtbC1 [Rhodothalassium salexigens DSM 2132]
MTFSLGGPHDPEKHAASRPPSLRNEEHGPQSGGSAMHSAGMPISHERLKTLAGAIEAGVIPRLLMAHRQDGATSPTPSAEADGGAMGYELTALDVDAYTRLILEDSAEAAAERIQEFHELGVPLESLYLDLLTPVARRLGGLWDEDLVDFTTVTTGMGRLSYIIRMLSRDTGAAFMREGRRVLLSTPPAEQHSFGLFMVSEFMRFAGWDVRSEPALSRGALIDTLRDESYVLVGFSLGSTKGLDWLKATIPAMRRASVNKDVCVMVGGPAFLTDPGLVDLVGADVMARDGREAAALAERAVSAPMRLNQ